MATHSIDLDEMLRWIDEKNDEQVPYASDSAAQGGRKRLYVKLRGGYKVMCGNDVIYDGTDGRSAVDAYNAI